MLLPSQSLVISALFQWGNWRYYVFRCQNIAIRMLQKKEKNQESELAYLCLMAELFFKEYSLYSIL